MCQLPERSPEEAAASIAVGTRHLGKPQPGPELFSLEGLRKVSQHVGRALF